MWSSGDATSARITVVNTTVQDFGNDFALDDISFAAAGVPGPSPLTPAGMAAKPVGNDVSPTILENPEPSALALVATAAVCLLGYSRGRSKGLRSRGRRGGA